MSWFDRITGSHGMGASKAPSPDQDRELVLYQYPSCPYCRRVLHLMDELDIELELKDTLQDPDARRELIELAGGTQVPCLVIDGVPLLESLDIMDWLRKYKGRS